VNFYAFHIGDYISATRHLTWIEDVAYRRLLDVYYVREAPLPLDMRAIYRLVSASNDEQREAVQTVVAEFFRQSEAGWHHERCDREIAKATEKKQKAQESARARWNANAVPSQSERNANAADRPCERIESGCEGNAPNPNPNPNPNPKVKPKDAVLRTESSPPENGVADPSEASAEPPDKPPKLVNGSVPSCPIEAVIEAYHEALPMLPRVAVRNTVRDRLVSARWRQVFADGKAHNREEGLLLFREFFAYCRESKFLTGQAKAQAPDRPPFMADLQWLMSPTNFAKTVEGRYHR